MCGIAAGLLTLSLVHSSNSSISWTVLLQVPALPFILICPVHSAKQLYHYAIQRRGLEAWYQQGGFAHAQSVSVGNLLVFSDPQ
jgi:hypothetical protein